FAADDANSAGLPGYYKGIFTVGTGGGVHKLVALSDTLPGLGPLNWPGTFDALSMSNGAVLFRANDGVNSALYIASGGTITRVIGTGDPLDGAHVAVSDGVFGPTPNALASNGTMVFYANLDNNKTRGLFAAIPNCAPNVTGQVAVTRG